MESGIWELLTVEIILLSLSVILQFTAAVLALRLIRITGNIRAWILIAVAIFLMGIRRLIVLSRFLFFSEHQKVDMMAEFVAIVISILMLIGIAQIAPLFRTIQDARERLARSNNELEEQVQIHSKKILETDEQLSYQIEERKKMEAELVKVQRLKSLVLLSGGIAHDFNNVLMAILGYISLAKSKSSPDSKSYELLQKAENATNRAKNLTQQLQKLSGQTVPIKKIVSVGDLFKKTIKDLHQLSLYPYHVDIQINDQLWLIEADEEQLKQVFYNVLQNAIQAMPDGGNLDISMTNTRINADEIPMLTEGNYILTKIRDNGTGIPLEIQNLVFDPYFTTYLNHSGLGLTTAYSIINNHNGSIRLESEPGVGTTCFIYLPTVNQRDKIKMILNPSNQKNGKILVMDDETDVQDVIGMMLKEMGYSVEFADNGESAIEKYRFAKDHGESYLFVILDLIVRGGMGGQETIVKLKCLDPDIKAIVASGHSDEFIFTEYRQYGFSGLLRKPFKIDELELVIRSVTE